MSGSGPTQGQNLQDFLAGTAARGKHQAESKKKTQLETDNQAFLILTIREMMAAASDNRNADRSDRANRHLFIREDVQDNYKAWTVSETTPVEAGRPGMFSFFASKKSKKNVDKSLKAQQNEAGLALEGDIKTMTQFMNQLHEKIGDAGKFVLGQISDSTFKQIAQDIAEFELAGLKAPIYIKTNNGEIISAEDYIKQHDSFKSHYESCKRTSAEKKDQQQTPSVAPESTAPAAPSSAPEPVAKRTRSTSSHTK